MANITNAPRAACFVLLLTVVLSSSALAQSTALVGATVIDGTGRSISDATVVVTRDRIACVGSAAQCAVPPAATRVDVAGRFITPGLVDAHVHFSQTGWIDGRPDGLPAPTIHPYAETARALRGNPARWFRSYLCSGITAVYDVGGHPGPRCCREERRTIRWRRTFARPVRSSRMPGDPR